MTTITIHRGTQQIGGCATEIKTDNARVFIDFGENLSDADAADAQIDGLTIGDCSRSALFLTHYHGDHIGRLGEVKQEVPMYMGETAKAIQLNYIGRVDKSSLPIFERIQTFAADKPVIVGDISVTPLMIDHSAFDAYMFIIETRGKRILYTGDFRLHGIRSKGMYKMLKHCVKNIDYIICEGTTLSRDDSGKQPWSEHEIKRRAEEYMKENKYVFVLCSSTHIDRIGAFYQANRKYKGRLFVCDSYRKKQLKTISEKHADKSSFYDFKDIRGFRRITDKLLNDMREKGFCMLVSQNETFKPVMERYKNDCLVIYSMWTGYIDERAKNQNLVDFLAPYKYRVLHTSGHASPEDLKKLYETVNPKIGLIPIHTDAPELFGKFVPKEKLIELADGEDFQV